MSSITINKHVLIMNLNLSGQIITATHTCGEVDFRSLIRQYGEKYIRGIAAHAYVIFARKMLLAIPGSFEIDAEISDLVTQDFLDILPGYYRYLEPKPSWTLSTFTAENEKSQSSLSSLLLALRQNPASKPIQKSFHDLQDDVAVLPFTGGKDSTAMELMLRKTHRVVKFLVRNQFTDLDWGFRDTIFWDIRTEINGKPAPHLSHLGCLLFPMICGLFIALSVKSKQIAMGFEKSVNEDNGYALGKYRMNHQGNKAYLQTSNVLENLISLSKNIKYTFPLSDMSDLEIASLIFREGVKTPLVFCNLSHSNSNCMKCAKCVYTILLLSHAYPTSQLEKIYEITFNTLDFSEILLWLVTGIKPLECVGFLEESRYLFVELSKKTQIAARFLPYVETVAKQIDFRKLREQSGIESSFNELLSS